ncbi:MAG: hypothetical protein MJY59_01510 [Bacteroidaceae bacterium]|nr:hypothetical protein [Bacteroidaceae bacterium]
MVKKKTYVRPLSVSRTLHQSSMCAGSDGGNIEGQTHRGSIEDDEVKSAAASGGCPW